jgi:hypothetical protein
MDCIYDALTLLQRCTDPPHSGYVKVGAQGSGSERNVVVWRRTKTTAMDDLRGCPYPCVARAKIIDCFQRDFSHDSWSPLFLKGQLLVTKV